MNEAALDLLKKIVDNGFLAYLVGGYPRDYYLGKNSIDYDVCTNATPMQLKEIFNESILKTEQYGSVTLIYQNMRFEITTFRKDIKYLNNRKPIEIEYIDSLLEDLKRRDFTMNTMCIDCNGSLLDLMNGKKDIENRIIRTVGDADYKVSEDSLRILRAIRFSTILDFNLDDSLKQAIIKHKDLLKNLSYYRKKEELDKIFASSNSKKGIDLIKELGLAEPLELSNIDNLVITTYLIGIWAQLDVLDKYAFNNIEKEDIRKINELMNKDVLDNNNLYKYGLYISTIVGEIKNIDTKLITNMYDNLYIHNKTEIKISADEICKALSRRPGSFLRDIFNDIENKLVNKSLRNENSELLNYVQDNYK